MMLFGFGVAAAGDVPASDLKEGACWVYYDETELGDCALFSGGRPGNTWFDGAYVGQSCEERAAWWSNQAWYQCFNGNGDAYPGSLLEWQHESAVVISAPHRGNHNEPPATDLKEGACWVYYNENELGDCELFSGGRPGNTWFDGAYEGQTCAERADWWSNQARIQCLSPSLVVDWKHSSAFVIVAPHPGTVVLTSGGSTPCKDAGLFDVWDTEECVSLAKTLGLSSANGALDNQDAAYVQNENDRPRGCRVQTFGPAAWINERASPAGQASEVHRVVCKTTGPNVGLRASTFKSVSCPEPVAYDDLAAVLESGNQPNAGYCTNEDADLVTSSSNRVHCPGGPSTPFGSSNGVGTDICKKYSWTYYVDAAGELKFYSGGPSWISADFVHGVILLDGVEIKRGLRQIAEIITAPVDAGTHIVELLAYENCCEGEFPGWVHTTFEVNDAVRRLEGHLPAPML